MKVDIRLNNLKPKIQELFIKGMSTNDIAKKLDISYSQANVKIGLIIANLMSKKSMNKYLDGKGFEKSKLVLLGKDAPYHTDESLYGLEMPEVTFFDLSHNEQMIYLEI